MKGPNTEQRKRPEGFHSARSNVGHPKREARRIGAAERLAAHVCGPTCKRNRIAA